MGAPTPSPAHTHTQTHKHVHIQPPREPPHRAQRKSALPIARTRSTGSHPTLGKCFNSSAVPPEWSRCTCVTAMKSTSAGSTCASSIACRRLSMYRRQIRLCAASKRSVRTAGPQTEYSRLRKRPGRHLGQGMQTWALRSQYPELRCGVSRNRHNRSRCILPQQLWSPCAWPACLAGSIDA